MPEPEWAFSAASRARLAGHAAGLACTEALALAGAAGDLAWLAGLQLLAALALVELAFALANRRGRRLRAQAARADFSPDPARARREALDAFTDGLPRRGALRSLAAWLLAALLLKAFAGLSWAGALLLLGFGALPAALAQGQLLASVARRAQAGADSPAPDAAPTLRRSLLLALAAPLAVVLPPLLTLAALGLAADLGTLLVLAVLGSLWALALGLALDRRWSGALRILTGGLRRLGSGDLEPARERSGEAGFDEAERALDAAALATARSRQALLRFVPQGGPGDAERRLDQAPAETVERTVAVLQARWLDLGAGPEGPKAQARFADLGRFYLAVEEAVLRKGGLVLEQGGGSVEAVWGALGSGDAPEVGALAAAWELRSTLEVLASQQRLRGAGSLRWSLALAWGPAWVGTWGPRDRRRFAVLGAAQARARSLALRPGGPWLDPDLGPTLVRPFGAEPADGAWLLTSGPQTGPGPDELGFRPGERLS